MSLLDAYRRSTGRTAPKLWGCPPPPSAWGTDDIEAWMKEKHTVNTLCGSTVIEYNGSMSDGSHCASCLQISAQMVEDCL